jgi:type IV secretion system protein VirD4
MNENEFLRKKPRDAKDEQLFNFLIKAVILATIFFGIWAGTQRFCYLVAYDPGWAGTPFYVLKIRNFIYPLYRPFLIFYWTLMYFKRTDIHHLLYLAYKIIWYTSVSAIAFYFLIEFVLMKYIAQNIFGTARWGNKKDLEKAGLLQKKGGMIIGQLADANVYTAYDNKRDSVILHLKKPSQKIIQSGPYNTLLSALTRSGKGISNVQPTIFSYSGSIIVLDFKGESFKFTSGFRSKFGKVYRWEPTGDKGHHFTTP